MITPLHSSDLKDLGYQAVQLITSSSSPLATLQHFSQDFPSQSSKIASVPINETLIEALRENTVVIPGGENIFWMNGMHIPAHKVEAFNLLSVMRRERNLISSLQKLGLTNREAVQFLTHEKIAEKIEIGTKNRFDARDDVEGGNVVIWLNDLEKDSRYSSWSTDIRNVPLSTPPFLSFFSLGVFADLRGRS
jgi:UDP-glucose:glycoprotein glucosyltransferase